MKVSNLSQLGPAMRQARLRAGLTLKQAAAATGIDYKTVSNIELGKTNPLAGLVINLVVAYGGRLDLTLPGETGGGQDG